MDTLGGQSGEQGTPLHHAKGFAESTVGANPMLSLGIMIGLFVLLLLTVVYYRSKKSSASFTSSRLHNLNGGGNNPQWQNGSLDAGNYGSVHRSVNRHQTHPFRHLNNRSRHSQSVLQQPQALLPGKVSNPQNISCPEGFRPYNSGLLGEKTKCVPSDFYDEDDDGITGSCSDKWSPEATAEAGALATVGSFSHDSYGEARLQAMINHASGAHEISNTVFDPVVDNNLLF
jgi:hypothetical protein